MDKDKKALTLFLVIIAVLSIAVETVWIIGGETATQAGISSVLMMSPLAAAIIVSFRYYKKQGALGLRKCKPRFILLSVSIPLAYLLSSYGLYWVFNKDSLSFSFTVLIEAAAAYSGRDLPDNIAIAISLAVMVPGSILTAFGEEVGWRGFMYPIMQRLWGFKKAIILSCTTWAVWHLPIIVAGLYYPPEMSLLFVIPLFIVEVLALTVIITWLRMKSNSVWPAILFHAAHNYFDQVVFQSMTSGVNSAYFVGEIGIITLTITVIAAILILVRDVKVFDSNTEA
ncbi:MAG: CPBP family intramembrane metalloprotease [Coriobacteriia bacterium]|nr:CPBP family intramembrane metalloprotease [Coriobacteriia bacterium]